MADSAKDENGGGVDHLAEPPSPLALTRSRRANAGAKMSQLITEEEQKGATGDTFYATTYGGFAEEENDIDYEAKSESGDEVDSDFDVELSDDNEGRGEEDASEGNRLKPKRARVDEDDEDEEEAERRRRRKALKRKRLSTPKHPGMESLKKPKKSAPTQEEKTNDEVNASMAADDSVGAEDESAKPVKRSALRTSTQIRSEMAEARRKVEKVRMTQRKEARSRKRQSGAHTRRRLTQAELLEEAKITEKLNTESLERFKKFEELKKEAQRVVKNRKVLTHLCTRFSSVTDKDEGAKCARTFVSFGDNKVFADIFKSKNKRSLPISRKVCPLTGLPAKYYDPVTKLPYANMQAFKMLRQIHADAVMKETSSTTASGGSQ